MFASTLVIVNNCKDNSSEPETLFEYNKRFTNSISIPENINVIKISNSIGFVIVNGTTNVNEASFLLDKTVKVKELSLSEEAFSKIVLNSSQVQDTLNIFVDSPENDNELFKNNLSINIPYNKKLFITKYNEGSYVSYLDSDVKIETVDYESTVNSVYGSINIKSIKGNITATTSLPENGNCTIISESGNIVVKIPASSNTNVNLKTDSGNLSYTNLNLTLTSSTSKEIKGTLNNNQGELYLYSNKGNVTLEGF